MDPREVVARRVLAACAELEKEAIGVDLEFPWLSITRSIKAYRHALASELMEVMPD